jgi:hypothetical protein
MTEEATVTEEADETGHGADAAPDDEVPKWLETFTVVLIALTAVLTAWTAFESSKWGGEMSIRFSEAGALRTESVRASNLANRQTVIDVTLFTSFADAYFDGDDARMAFYQERFPERLAVAVDAWIASQPLIDPEAAASPFDLPEYRLEAAEESAALEDDAEARSGLARQANQRGDNYQVTSIFLATVLLLAAVSTRVTDRRTQVVLVVLATGIFLVVGGVVATFPVLV